MGELFSSDSTATTEIEIIKSRMILGDTVEKFNLTTLVTPDYFPVIGKGIARLSGRVNQLQVSRFELPDFATTLAHQIVVQDAEQGTYQLVRGDGQVILQGVAGELAEQDDYRLFVTGMEAESGFAFNIAKINELDAINELKQNLSIAEKGKQTGIVELSLTGENSAQIRTLLDNISQNYFLQNVKRNSAEAEKSLSFLQSHLPDIKTDLDSSEDVLNRYRQDNESIDLSLEAKATLDVMVKLEAQLNELTFKESEISQRFTTDHPAYKSLLDKRQVLLKERERINHQVQSYRNPARNPTHDA